MLLSERVGKVWALERTSGVASGAPRHGIAARQMDWVRIAEDSGVRVAGFGRRMEEGGTVPR